MTEFVKGRVFTVAEVREAKDGQIQAKVDVIIAAITILRTISTYLQHHHHDQQPQHQHHDQPSG